MTLLELSVVILVLLSLLFILFVGAQAWIKGSDRAANILNIRNVQQAVRAHANSRALDFGASLLEGEIIGPDKYLSRVNPPNIRIVYQGEYDITIPVLGSLYLTPAYTDTASAFDYSPTASSYVAW